MHAALTEMPLDLVLAGKAETKAGFLDVLDRLGGFKSELDDAQRRHTPDGRRLHGIP